MLEETVDHETDPAASLKKNTPTRIGFPSDCFSFQ